MPTDEHLQLPDGRRLDIAVSGPTNGMPIIFHHGTPGAAVSIRAIERAAHARGLQLVTISRPGYGSSSRQRDRSVVDVVADVSVTLSAMGSEHCLIAGWSGGGPHALACAARLDGVKAVSVISGVAPYEAQGLDFLAGMGEENVVEFKAALSGEDTIRQFLVVVREHLKDVTAEGIISSLDTLLPDVDRAVLTDDVGEDMAASFHEALRLGVDGWVDDDLAFIKPWGFSLDEISVPVMIWQGSADLMVPFAHGQWLSSNVPGATVHLLEGEGHLSVGIGALEQLFDELITLSEAN